jgi:hypothetical protein
MTSIHSITAATKKYARLISVITLGIVMSACNTLPQREGSVDAVLAASGLEEQLTRLQQPLPVGQAKGPAMLIPDEWLTMVNTAVAETLKPEAMRADLRSALLKELSSRELATTQAFFTSEVGKKVVELEGGKSVVSGPSQLSEATLNDIAQTTGIGKATSLLAERALTEAVDIAFKHQCFGLDKVPFAGLLGGVMKKAQLSILRDSVNTRLHSRYAGLSESEADRYLDFAQSAAGKKFFNARTAVLTDYAGRAGDSLQGTLTKAVTAVCHKQ